MKIAIFTDSFIPLINGIVTSVIDLAKGMTDRGHKVYIIAPKEKREYEKFQYKDIEVLRIPAVDASFYDGFKWSAVFHKPTYKKLKEENIDIVHFMTPVTASLFGILVAKWLKKPMIGTYHTFVSELEYIRQFLPLAGKGTQKFVWKYTNGFYNRADIITTPTENAKKELLVNKCKVPVEVVSNGIRLDSFDNSKSSDIKEKYNPNGELILYVGRIAPEKNMLCLLEAFKNLSLEDKTTKMLVVGGGPSENECIEYVKSNNLTYRVIFLGLIPTQKLKESGIFGACRIFATASTTETQGITILEAEANGIPCIGPNAKGIPNVIADGINGFVVEPNNCEQITQKMKLLLEDDKLYEKFKNNAIESVKKHDINIILDQWEDRYKRVIANPRKHSRKTDY